MAHLRHGLIDPREETSPMNQRKSEGPALGFSLDVREQLIDALRLDLVSPWPGHEYAGERLPCRNRPSGWYLTGFPRRRRPSSSVPPTSRTRSKSSPSHRDCPRRAPRSRQEELLSFFDGAEFLVPAHAKAISVRVAWGDYVTPG